MSARFTERDLERWVERGLLSAEQRDAILEELATRPPDEGLSVVTLLYYGGGLLVLLAYGIFLGFQWEEMNEAGRVVISAISLGFFTAISTFLIRNQRFRVPGELLQVVAVAAVPLLAFAVLDAVGIWPDDPGFRAPIQEREAYQTDLAWARMGIAGVTLVGAWAAFRHSRSPYALVAGVLSVTWLVLDVGFQIQPDRVRFEWDTLQWIALAILGAGTTAAGVLVSGKTERDYSLWLYALGLAGLAIGLGVQAFDTDAWTWGALWLAVALVIVALSVPLQQRLFAAAGLAGVFVYMGRLVFDVFETAGAALAFVILGMMVLAAGAIYQRFSERLYERGGET